MTNPHESSFGAPSQSFVVGGAGDRTDYTNETPPPVSSPTPKLPRAGRTIPEGTVLPDRGWPKWKYRFLKLVGRPDKVPTISRKQYRDELIQRLRELSNLGVAPIMFFANIKSAGKSSAAIGVGSVVKFHTQKSTLLLPATINSATATAGQMAGISGNAVSVSEFGRDIKQFGTARALEQRLPLTKCGLGVIVEDQNSAADEDDAEATMAFMEMVDVLLPKVSVLILDGGNDNVSKRSLALQAARLSHVFNFVFMVDSVITQRTLNSTVMGFWGDTGIPPDVEQEFFMPFEHKADSGWRTPTRAKVENSIVIATKAGRRKRVDFDYFMTPHQDARSDVLPQWRGTGLRVPIDKSIGREGKDGKLVPFDLDALDLETYIAYLEIAVANFELAGHQTGVSIGKPMVANLPARLPGTPHASSGWSHREGGTS